MIKKILFVGMIAILLAAPLAGCVRSASRATTTPGAPLDFPTPIPEDAMKNILSQTQTAIAQGGEPVVEQPTQAGGEAVATAVPQATAQPAVQEPVKAIPTVTRPKVYTLQKGEWPICIARRFDLNVAELLNLNGLTLDSKPAVGFELKIPTGGKWNSGSRSLMNHPTTYTVKSGDTIYTIACAFGDVDPSGIIAANNLKSPYTLTPGDKLQIP